jgi:2-polyprenyl-6-methoxyphenol hydroxylase-like FAD-dependent oxidoreductase
MNLARKGHRVLLVDRATFPSDTLSTHVLTGDACFRLRQWGVMEQLLAAGSRLTAKALFHTQGQVFAMEGEGMAPRRTILDKTLIDAARAAGAEVREGFSVRGLVTDADGRVTGIDGEQGGVAVREEARIVIGADGRNSVVAKAVGAPEYNSLEPQTCGFYSYFSGIELENPELHFIENRVAFMFPTNGGQACLAVEYPTAMFQEVRADTDGFQQRTYEMAGLGERYRGGTRVEPWKGAANLPNRYRKPFGPGWALAGDSGYIKDPVLGQGINDAFRDADALSAALDRVFAHGADMDAEMAAYQQQRDVATAGVYAFNYEFSKLNVTPDMVQMLMMAAAMQQQMAAAAGGAVA